MSKNKKIRALLSQYNQELRDARAANLADSNRRKDADEESLKEARYQRFLTLLREAYSKELPGRCGNYQRGLSRRKTRVCNINDVTRLVVLCMLIVGVAATSQQVATSQTVKQSQPTAAKVLPKKTIGGLPAPVDRSLSVAIPAKRHNDRFDSYRLQSLGIGRGMRVSRYALLSNSSGASVQTGGVVVESKLRRRLGYVATENPLANLPFPKQQRWFQCNQKLKSTGLVTAAVESFDMGHGCNVMFYMAYEGRPLLANFSCRFNGGPTPVLARSRCWCTVSLLDVVHEVNATYFPLMRERTVDEVFRRDLAEVEFRRELVRRLYDYYVTHFSEEFTLGMPSENFITSRGYSRR